MINAVSTLIRRVSNGWIVATIVALTTVLGWLGYTAVAEWQRSARLLAQRRVDSSVDLLVTALTRDMRAVQTSVLPYLGFEQQTMHSLPDVHSIGSAFARYPYPEAFFAAGDLDHGGQATFYLRNDRPAPWAPRPPQSSRFPVLVTTNAAMSREVLGQVATTQREKRRFATFAFVAGDVPYQAVALLSYTDPLREHVAATVGFLVNMAWVRRHYFPEFSHQIARIQGVDSGVQLGILDPSGASLVHGNSEPSDLPASTRRFPGVFFDPDIAGLEPSPDFADQLWTARGSIVDDRALSAARTGAARTMVLAALSLLLLAAGFALTLYAARTNIELMNMRSEFVSAVTHELKTPIATIRAVGDAVASGRVRDVSRLKDYAQLVVQESKRLTRLFDNLLAYSRIADITEAYHFESLEVQSLIHEAVRGFAPQLAASDFHVKVDLPEGLARVRADRMAMILLLDNIIDNAIRYSAERHLLAIGAMQSNDRVDIVIADAGIGIDSDEIELVTRRFFRGRRAGSGGSGLGLAIVNHIVRDHGGTMCIQSVVDSGTTVTVSLPVGQV